MKKIKNIIPLHHRVTVYVPSTDNVNQEIDNTIYVENTAKFLSNLFGGATSTPANGYWISNNGQLVKENTVLVFSYAKNLTNANIDCIVSYCEELKNSLHQEAISLEINGQLYFI